MADSGAERVMTLQEVADELGVHYMTAYRWVRLGQLDARKVGGGWRVSPQAVDALRAERSGNGGGGARTAPGGSRLESRLLVGDASGAWGVIEAAMAAGWEVGSVYLEILAPAMQSIGDRWEAGEIDVAVEHRASGIVARIIGRLGARCVRPGRSRGCILLGSPAGERHSLVVSMLADLMRLEGWEVSDLGADTPCESFVVAARMSEGLIAIGLSVTHPDHLDECAATCEALRAGGIEVPILVGGQAIEGLAHARALGADAYAADARAMVATLSAISGSAA